MTGEAELSGLVVRPYASVAYERELDDDPVSVTAGSNTMAGRFTAEGFKPPRHGISADVGVSASLGGQASAVLGYSGRSGDASRGDHLVSAGCASRSDPGDKSGLVRRSFKLSCGSMD